MKWQTKNCLPLDEPNDYNCSDYAHPQLLSGVSDDGRYLYDVVWAEMQEYFVLTLLCLNTEWGFIENERYLYPDTRAELLCLVAQFEQNPSSLLD